jgi:hypothetical protein
MKRLMLCLIATFVVFQAISQTRIGIVASGDYNDWIFTERLSRDFYREGSTPRLGNALGIQFSFPKRESYRFDFGLTYLEHNSRFSYSYGYQYSSQQDSYFNISSVQKMQLLAIPCNFNFYFNEGSSKLFIVLGAIPMIEISNKVKGSIFSGGDFYDYQYKTKNQGIDKFYLGTSFAVGLWQHISPSIDLSIAH